MKGAPLEHVPLPEIPPGGKRRCTGCLEYKQLPQSFSTVLHTLKTGRKKRYWRSRCKDCEREARKGRPKGKDSWTIAEKRARDKALTRLGKITPTIYLPIFLEEITKAYRAEGYSEQQAKQMAEYKAQFIRYYIKAQYD